MAKQTLILLEIVTPEGEVYRKPVEQFYLPTEIGEIGVLANHGALLSAIVPGVLRLWQDGEVRRVAVGRGFLDVIHNQAEILVQSAELSENIDVRRAVAAKERAEARLEAASFDRTLDELRAKNALARANARLTAVGDWQKYL